VTETEGTAMIKRAKNWGVLMYILAGLASIAMPVILTVAPRSATYLPQPAYEDVVRVIRSAYP
jgi:AmiR/NasT family two-component response regulator